MDEKGNGDGGLASLLAHAREGVRRPGSLACSRVAREAGQPSRPAMRGAGKVNN